MYVNVIEDGVSKCLWVLPKLENIVLTRIVKKRDCSALD